MASTVSSRLVLRIGVTYVRTEYEIRVFHSLSSILHNEVVVHVKSFANVTDEIANLLPADFRHFLESRIKEAFNTEALKLQRSSVLDVSYLQRTRSQPLKFMATIDLQASSDDFILC